MQVIFFFHVWAAESGNIILLDNYPDIILYNFSYLFQHQQAMPAILTCRARDGNISMTTGVFINSQALGALPERREHITVNAPHGDINNAFSSSPEQYHR